MEGERERWGWRWIDRGIVLSFVPVSLHMEGWGDGEGRERVVHMSRLDFSLLPFERTILCLSSLHHDYLLLDPLAPPYLLRYAPPLLREEPHVRVLIHLEPLESGPDTFSYEVGAAGVGSEGEGEYFKGFRDVEADVGDAVEGERVDDGEDGDLDSGEVECGCHSLRESNSSVHLVGREGAGTHGNGKDGRHPLEVHGILPVPEDLGHDNLLRPLDPKRLCQLPQVDRRGFSDREDGVGEPCHAEVAQLVVEELHAELLGEEGDVFDDCLTDSPLLVLGELNDGR